MSNRPEKKDEDTAEGIVEPVEGDVQGNVQIKMVVSNGKVCHYFTNFNCN